MSATLIVEGLGLAFNDAEGAAFPVLDIPEFQVAPGALSVISGPSGSGKSTLLHCLSGLQAPDRGRILWDGADITRLSEAGRDRWRRQTVGLVFQGFHLIDEMTPIDNVLAPGWLARFSVADLRPRAEVLLSEFGVPAGRRRLSLLSRGEQQRVALARALIFDPPVILADEPTASLDRVASALVIDRLAALAEEGRTVLAVSHDPDLIAAADRLFLLERGRLVEGRKAA